MTLTNGSENRRKAIALRLEWSHEFERNQAQQ